MNSFVTAFTQSELDILRSIVGSEWRCYGGSTFVHEGQFALGEMFIETSTRTLSIESELITCPFPTGSEDLARLHVRDGSTDGARASRAGGLFFHDKGSVVNDLSIVRANVVIEYSDRDQFEISMDHAVLLHFAGHDLVISRGSWFVETLAVSRSLPGDRIDVREVDWDPDLEANYSISHETRSIEAVVD